MIYTDDIQSAAEDMFGADNIDLQHTSSNHHNLIIYWDEIEVSNENDDKHTIYDMYANVEFSNNCELISFKLTRSTLTADEFNAGYVFSHLPRLSTRLEYTTPCLGRGPIRNTMTSLARMYDPDLFRLFLVELDRYVRTESLAGGPYIKMSEIGNVYTCKYNVGSVNANQYVCGRARDLYNYIRKECPIEPVIVDNCIDFGDLYNIIRKVSLIALDYINKLNIDPDIYFSIASVNDGVIYIGKQSNTIDPKSIHLSVVFKGVHKEFKIKNDNTSQQDMYVIKPDIMSGILSLMYLDYYTNEFEYDESEEIKP